MIQNKIHILQIEDNPGDVRLTREAFKTCRAEHHLSVVNDGEEALEFLHQTGPYADAPRPDLILLDLNLPKKDGREVLEQIKGEADLHQIPVLILTTSDAEEDIIKTYDLYANCFIPKPADLDEFINVIQNIEHFWMSLVKLPNNRERT